jgi:hypothetical protein
VFAVPRSMAISVEKNLLNFIRTPALVFLKTWTNYGLMKLKQLKRKSSK